jgi:hypothetical protein
MSVALSHAATGGAPLPRMQISMPASKPSRIVSFPDPAPIMSTRRICCAKTRVHNGVVVRSEMVLTGQTHDELSY